ncbi:WhiB family transcriptional regulator [Mycobacterium sp. M1]|uniref:Transcriptional regulator WhiB n=1 Tax=Mycolicibacter acidiphilus TaxID=2835306 RepID=A0ABS5RI97_9MYCO|nr:WhiB family transcriptional regulator [Mycolicibacter acidiphilus]MBS9533742.1 WhiB family transcriptional regulator [Mycolicibacter acidiphilus]
MPTPCATDPELFFGYPDDYGADGAAKARADAESSAAARLICLRRCPLGQQRRCAALALERGEEYGVWAGIKLPGGQYRKRAELARAHEVLRAIATGAVNPRELPENQELLARHESDRVVTRATVFHVPTARVVPSSAA